MMHFGGNDALRGTSAQNGALRLDYILRGNNDVLGGGSNNRLRGAMMYSAEQ